MLDCVKQWIRSWLGVNDAPSKPAQKVGIKIAVDSVLKMRERAKARKMIKEMCAPFEPVRGVLPMGSHAGKLAMDAGFDVNAVGQSADLMNSINSAYMEGWAFPGFVALGNWSQISEFRKPAEIYAREMTRKWIKFQSVGDTDKTERINAVQAEFKRLNVQSKFRETIEQDGLFGRSHIFIDMGAENDTGDELKTQLAEDPHKVPKGAKIVRLTVIEPVWTYPNRYNANNPLDPTFYKPISWFVMGKEVHSSRLLTFISRELPDILKPAYAFAGLSLSQMMKPYVDNWLRTRQSVSDLVHSFTVWTLKTDMSTILNAGGAESFFDRLQIFNLGRDNHGINAINNDTEEFDNVSAPLGGLDHLQNQAIEHMAVPAGLPLIYLTGITPSGLNASSEGDIRIFQDNIAAKQEIFTPHISKILNIVMLGLFGELDPDIGFVWEPLYTMSEGELTTARKTEADTDSVYIDCGVLSPQEVRTKVANEEDSPYQGLDLSEDLATPEEEPEDDLTQRGFHGQAARTPGPGEKGGEE